MLPLFLELKHNPATRFLEGDDYLHRCIAARRLLPLASKALLLPSGGSVLADVAFANEHPEDLARCLDVVRAFSIPRTEEWRILLIAADGSGRAAAPNEQTLRFLQQRNMEARVATAPYHSPLLPPLLTAPYRRPLSPPVLKVRMLDAARWVELAAEEEAHLPPLLLRVALRESVKRDTAPYRRHTVVLSPLAAVSEAKRRLGLQLQVCRPAALHDYLSWLRQARLTVEARG